MDYLEKIKLDQEAYILQKRLEKNKDEIKEKFDNFKEEELLDLEEELLVDLEKEKEEEEQKNLQPINVDLIKELRAQGRHSDAQELLNAFRRNCIEQKITDEIYLRRMDDRKNKMILHKNGLCTVCAKNKPRNKNYKTCDECLIKYYNRKGINKPSRRKLTDEEKIEKKRLDVEKKKENYYKNKSLGICVSCKKEKAIENSTNCSFCTIRIRKQRQKLRDKRKRLAKK